MSKITIPLAIILALVGFAVFAKLNHDAKEKRTQPATANASQSDKSAGASEAFDLDPKLSGKEFRQRTRDQISSIRRLPVAPDAQPVSFLWPTDGNDLPALPVALNFAATDSFDAWKSYTDGHIAFYYPDAPGVQVEVLAPMDPIPLIGKTMLPPESGVFRRYRITAGKDASLCVINLSHSNNFTDEARAPMPEIFHRYTASGGGLLRTAFSEDGQVRRTELLGNSLRVSLLDWPNLAVHQDVYLRIATGIELPRPHQDWNELRDAAIDKYGFSARLGLLNPGASLSEITELLGTPDSNDAQRGALQYFHSARGQTILYTLQIENDRFKGFGKNWREIPRWMPNEGSLRWMVEKTDYAAGKAGGIGYNLGALSDEDATGIYERIIALAPTAGPADWDLLSQAVANLAQHGIHDERIIEIARTKLDSPNLDPAPSLLVLEVSRTDQGKGAIAGYIAQELSKDDLSPDTLEEFYTLIAYLGRNHPATNSLIDRALVHPSARVRELGFLFCTWHPQALTHLEAGLQDESVQVRRCSAEAFADRYGDPIRHLKVLQVCLENERDEEVRLLLKTALDRLGNSS